MGWWCAVSSVGDHSGEQAFAFVASPERGAARQRGEAVSNGVLVRHWFAGRDGSIRDTRK